MVLAAATMGRHELISLNPMHQVVVGWNRPLRILFAQVLNATASRDSDKRTILLDHYNPRSSRYRV